MKLFKRTLSLVLALVMVLSVASFAVSANSGSKELDLLTDVYADSRNSWALDEVTGWKTYYFYMPDSWMNEYNDYYDSNGTYAAGIYWWEGAFNAKDFANDWPGFAVLPVDGYKNIYCAQVPENVYTIIWNNTVDGGSDPTDPARDSAAQTQNIACAWYDPGEDSYGFYPDGVASFDNMIYVIDMDAELEDNEFSGASTTPGEWFYYYGNGQYGAYATYEEAAAAEAVFSNGKFPEYGMQLSVGTKSIAVGDKTTAVPDTDADVTVSNGNVKVSATTIKAGEALTITGVKAGTSVITFTYINGKNEVATKELEITVVADSLFKTSVSLKAAETTTLRMKVGTAKSFKSSNTKVAKVDSKGKVTALKKGTAKITVTTKSGQKLTCTVKVTSSPKVTQKAKTVKVKKTVTAFKVTGVVSISVKSSNSKIAKVSKTVKNGVCTVKVKGVKKGTAKITITANGVKTTKKITVKK